MKNYLKTLTIITVCLIISPSIKAQEENPPFWDDIQDFKKQDEANPPDDHTILFIGSSSFTKWDDVQDYFPDYPIINRGFGGSTLKDVIRYEDDIIFPYKPKQIVIYAGDNDAASSDTISSKDIVSRFKTLFNDVRDELPQTQITYISIKPSPSREEFFPVMQKANWDIHQFLKEKIRARFIDIWHPMLDEYGEAREELFGDDRLHMNDKGYEIWQDAIQPHLLR